jgi:hypothetical protein
MARMQCEPHIDGDSRLYRAEASPSDHRGPYSHDKLLRMNARFIARVERAFANGTESRAAASATHWNCPRGVSRELGAF